MAHRQKRREAGSLWARRKRDKRLHLRLVRRELHSSTAWKAQAEIRNILVEMRALEMEFFLDDEKE